MHWATVRAGDERAAATVGTGTVPAHGIELVPSAEAVRIGPQVVRLGSQEFAVLAATVRRPGVVLDVRQVRHEVSRIRRKLGEHAVTVRTVRGVGYKYVPPQVR